jgi:hypothetical protein
MSKINFVLIFIFIFAINCRINLIDDVLDDYDIKYEEYLRNNLMEYLKEKGYINSEDLISQEDMKKIIVDLMLEGISPEEISENTMQTYIELSNVLTKKYYKESKEIKGKDLKKIINIKELTKEYYLLTGEAPIYDDDYIFYDETIIDDINNDDDLGSNDDFDL